MKTISIDVESYSGNDLGKCGVYKYVQHPDFDILLFGYAVDGGDVRVVDLASGETLPEEVLAALSDKTVTKWAFNSNFERVCLSEWLRRNHSECFRSYSDDGDTVGGYLDPHGWKCSMVWSAYMGLPLSLAGAGAVLGLEEQKLKEGKDLISISACRVKQQRPMEEGPGTSRNMTGRNGSVSSPIIRGMWRWRCPSRKNCGIFRCRILSGKSFGLTRRSMTGDPAGYEFSGERNPAGWDF